LREQWGRNSFYHFLWFEIRKRLTLIGISEEVSEKIKKEFYDSVKGLELPGYYRFVFIR
jgi:hypothetical protein